MASAFSLSNCASASCSSFYFSRLSSAILMALSMLHAPPMNPELWTKSMSGMPDFSYSSAALMPLQSTWSGHLISNVSGRGGTVHALNIPLESFMNTNLILPWHFSSSSKSNIVDFQGHAPPWKLMNWPLGWNSLRASQAFLKTALAGITTLMIPWSAQRNSSSVIFIDFLNWLCWCLRWGSSSSCVSFH